MGIIITESLQKHYVEIIASHEGVVGIAFAQVAEASPDWAPKKVASLDHWHLIFQGPLQEINILLSFKFELTWNIPIHNGIRRGSRFTTLAPKTRCFHILPANPTCNGTDEQDESCGNPRIAGCGGSFSG